MRTPKYGEETSIEERKNMGEIWNKNVQVIFTHLLKAKEVLGRIF